MKPYRHHLVALGVLALLNAQAFAQTAAPAVAPGLDCMLQPHQMVQVGTAAPGVIRSMTVDRGDFVKKGQPLVQLNAAVERAALAVARERASQSGELVAARGAHDLAKREAQRAADLVEENFVSRTFYDKQRAEAQVAAGRGTQAQEKIRLAERELALANAQLSQRTVYSPIDGVVVERFASPGEYVEQKPVLRIAGIDPLRVDVLVPAAAFGQVSLGAKASVVPELINRKALVATVTSVDRVVDAASNTFRVRLELPNPGGALPPGLRCKADLGLRNSDATARNAAAAAFVPMATQAMVRRTEPVEPAVAAAEAVRRAAPVVALQVRPAAASGLRLRMAPIELPVPVAHTQLQEAPAPAVAPATLAPQAPVAKPRQEPPLPYPGTAKGGALFQFSARAPLDLPDLASTAVAQAGQGSREREEALPWNHAATFAQYVPRR